MNTCTFTMSLAIQLVKLTVQLMVKVEKHGIRIFASKTYHNQCYLEKVNKGIVYSLERLID